MSLNFSHIPYAQLVDWVEGRLPAAQQATLATHLETCARCRDEAARIERVVAIMRADASQDAPPAVIARAVHLFRTKAVDPAPSLVQRLVAALRFESTPLTPAFGLRSAGSSERQMIYTVGDYDIDLRIAPSAAGWLLSGQVLGPGAETGAALLSGGDAMLRTGVGEDAAFAFPPASAGEYSLTLTLGEIELVVEALRMGEG